MNKTVSFGARTVSVRTEVRFGRCQCDALAAAHCAPLVVDMGYDKPEARRYSHPQPDVPVGAEAVGRSSIPCLMECFMLMFDLRCELIQMGRVKGQCE